MNQPSGDDRGSSLARSDAGCIFDPLRRLAINRGNAFGGGVQMPRMRVASGRVPSVLGLLGGLGLLGCGSTSSPTAPSANTGNLMVTITAPAGVTPSVALNGPAGYHLSLTASQTLSGLVPGTYTLTASSVVVANPIVATVYSATITGGTLTLAAGATAMASVSYAPQPGSGALWVVNPNRSTVVAYPAAQLVSNLPTPAVTLSATAGSLNVPFGLAFDVRGNLWIVNGDGPTVVEFAASQLGASGSPIP